MNNIDNLITQAEAARLRGVSRSRISMLVKKGRLVVYNGKYLDKTEVMSLQPKKSGAPRKISL